MTPVAEPRYAAIVRVPGGGDAAGLGDAQEVAELPDVHGSKV